MSNRCCYYQPKENFEIWGQKTDPLDKSGNTSDCAMCQSIYHWANDCPNKVKEDSSNNVKIILFTQDVHSCYIDIGCTNKVCEQSCLDSYLDSLTTGDLLKVVEERSSSSFKFVDGNIVLSIKTVTIPATVGN